MAFEWLIDLMKDWVKLYFKGMIVAWSGAVVDIPDGWALCDGTNGTPDLGHRFIRGFKPPVPPLFGTGGTLSHDHNFTGDGHRHTRPPVEILQYGNDHRPYDGEVQVTGTTDAGDNLPPYMVLCWIMKL